MASRRIMANVIVLTKAASQAASCKKDGARSIAADQGLFLSEMGIVAGDHRLVCNSASAGFTLEPVYPTISWTEGAFTQGVEGSLKPFGEES